MAIELTAEVRPAHVQAVLDLEYEASAPLYEFVYGNEDQARVVQRMLFDSQAVEWAPPWGRIAVRDGQLVGLVGGALGRDLRRIRMQASLVLGRAGLLDDAALVRRMQLGVGALAQPDDEDFYFSVLAVAPAARKSDAAAEIIAAAREEARHSGAKRYLGQTIPTAERLAAYYERTGHHWIGEGSAHDPATGRDLVYRHFAFTLQH